MAEPRDQSVLGLTAKISPAKAGLVGFLSSVRPDPRSREEGKNDPPFSYFQPPRVRMRVGSHQPP